MKILLCCLIGCTFWGEGIASENNAMPPQETDTKVQDSSLTCTALYRTETSQEGKKGDVSFTFTNSGTKTIRLLDKFTPKYIMQAFFDINLRKKDGEKLTLKEEGRIGCFETGVNTKYKELKAGESFSVNIPLEDHIRKTFTNGLPHGEYILQITYHNKWGLDCVTGNYSTPSITFKVD